MSLLGSLTRQQLYDRIRESSKDEVILEEMIRHGFWPDGADQPSPPGALIKRQGEIGREIAELHKKAALWRDPETALKEMHKRRKRAAMERRKETKLRNAQTRHDRALGWHKRRAEEILYLGPDVSGGLRADGAKPGSLKAGLPEIGSARALAEAIGITMAELRFLGYDRPLSRVSHYQRFAIPKKAGGLRLISAPMPRLKRAQYWILDTLLAKAPVHEAAHGFVPGRSIVTNARAHVGRDVVVNCDLKDFFPSLTFRRVKGKFRGLGYPEAVATILALICTEPDVDALELDGERLFAAKGPRRLPQGAPTSPALTNLVCMRLDARLTGLARSLGFTYTRYADDMTFSGSGEAAGRVGPLLKYLAEIVTAEGFTLHPDKTRVMRRGSHQEVTGLTVNEAVAVPRETLRRFRALLHQIGRSGPAGKRWGRSDDVMTAAHGFACFVRMVSPETGARLLAELRALAASHGAPAPRPPAQPDFRMKSARGQAPLAAWRSAAEPTPPAPEPILLAQAAEARPAAASPAPRIAPGARPGGGASPIRDEMRGASGLWNSGPAGPPATGGAAGRIALTLLKAFGLFLLLSLTLGLFPPLGMVLLIGVIAWGLYRLLKRL